MTDHPMTAPREGEGGPSAEVNAIDDLLENFQRACERVVSEGDSRLSATTKERAILRNELRARLLASRSQPPVTLAGEPERIDAIAIALCKEWGYAWEPCEGCRAVDAEFDEEDDSECEGMSKGGMCLGPNGRNDTLTGEAETPTRSDFRRLARAALAASQPPVTIEPSGIEQAMDDLLRRLLIWGGHNAECYSALRRNPSTRCFCGWDWYRKDMEAMLARLSTSPLGDLPIDAECWREFLSVRTLNALFNRFGRAATAGQVFAVSDDELLHVADLGPVGVAQVRDARMRLLDRAASLSETRDEERK